MRKFRWLRAPLRESGQATPEYVGVVLFLCLVLGALAVSGTASRVADGVGGAIERAFCKVGSDRNCGGGPGVAAHAPPIGEGGRRQIFDARYSNDLPGELVREDGDEPTGDAEVDAAHDNFARIYDYFLDRFRRDSYDGEGAPMIASVRYREDPDEPFRNA